MPVKWDAEKDKFILNSLLLDPSINIGTAVIDGICTSWPAEFGDAPTRKAITEHFSKIRKMNKKFSSGGGGAVETRNATPTKVNKTKATPVKKNNGVKTPASKRKRSAAAHVSDDDEDMVDGVPRGELAGLEGGDDAMDESPSKRARVQVKYEETDDEGVQDSGSEYHGDEA